MYGGYAEAVCFFIFVGSVGTNKFAVNVYIVALEFLNKDLFSDRGVFISEINGTMFFSPLDAEPSCESSSAMLMPMSVKS